MAQQGGVFGARLREVRERNGKTQDVLARQLKVSVRTLQNWESGKIVPRKTTQTFIARKLKVRLAWLVGDEDEEPTAVPQEALA